MQTARQGDRVLVHYVKRASNGDTATSRGRSPMELIVGADHPCLPGLKLTLVGMAVGDRATLTVPADQAHGPADPTRLRRLPRSRLPADARLRRGEWIRLANSRGRRRTFRIVAVGQRSIVIDANHRWAGQSLELEIELVAIRPGGSIPGSQGQRPTSHLSSEPARVHAPVTLIGTGLLPDRGRAVAFDVDAATVSSLQHAFPSWTIETINHADIGELMNNCDLWAAELLILGIRPSYDETLAFCRFLSQRPQFSGGGVASGVEGEDNSGAGWRQPSRKAAPPLLVLVQPGQETLVRAALDAGAHCCLVLPIYAAQVIAMMAHAFDGNRPGRHTPNLNHAQTADELRDDGGEA